MGLRTIEAPGVEIKEIDKSGYTPAMTGTRCYVMGYATKGEPYTPMEFTSKAAWQSYYGEPDNEAERYFYNACSEVINQNGVLYCARLPYDNDAYNKMVGIKYNVGTKTKQIKNANDFLQDEAIFNIVKHDKEYEYDSLKYVIENNIKREIDGQLSNGMEVDDEVKSFLLNALNRYQNDESKKRFTIRYYELNKTESEKTILNFYNEEKAKDYIASYKSVHEDQDFVVKYIDYVNPKSDNDFEAGILKYDYKVGVIDLDFNFLSNYVNLDLNFGDINDPANKTFKFIYDAVCKINEHLELGLIESQTVEELCRQINHIANKIGVEIVDITTNSTVGDVWNAIIKILNTRQDPTDEIDEIEAFIIKEFLKDELSKIQIKDLEFEKYIDITSEAEGFNFEKFFTKTINELSVELDLLNQTDEIYVPFKECSLSTKENGYLVKNYKLNENTNYDIEYFIDFDDILKYYRDNATITVEDLYSKYNLNKAFVEKQLPYYQIREVDTNIRDYIEISHSGKPTTEDIPVVQEYATGESKVPAQTFWIFDRTCARLNKISEDERKGKERELVGIFPVVTTAANALFAQKMIIVGDEQVKDYESVTGTVTKDWKDEEGNDFSGFSLLDKDLVKKLSNKDVDYTKYGILETVSQEANNYFSTINMNADATGLDSENLKKIGVVVFKAYIDPSEGGKVNFTPVESFCGSLDKDAKNPTTGASTFIDKIINGLSQYIYFFSNCFTTKTAKKMLNEEADIFIIKPGTTGMLGFYESETAETLSLAKLYSSIDTCFELVKNINDRDIDIIPDAGLANIAYYISAMKDKAGIPEPMYYDMEPTDKDGNAKIGFWTCKSASDLNAWKTVEFKLDNFCKNVRKDCMFITDGPRPMVLQGQKKIVRPSKPSNTIDANILPFVKYASGINTDYGAGYLGWFQITDEFSGDEFWCPPSIKAMGVYINTDLNFNYWDAPAGLNRGVVQALDVAFSPTIKQAGSIYGKSWNYAINYPNDGIVLEGQKTFQTRPSAFDRVNVRRLFLRLERLVYKVARYYVYEPNNSYTRQRLVDTLNPIFQQVKAMGGLYDYIINCSEKNNTPESIERNELHVDIGLKATRTSEFLMISFTNCGLRGDWSEYGL